MGEDLQTDWIRNDARIRSLLCGRWGGTVPLLQSWFPNSLFPSPRSFQLSANAYSSWQRYQKNKRLSTFGHMSMSNYPWFRSKKLPWSWEIRSDSSQLNSWQMDPALPWKLEQGFISSICSWSSSSKSWSFLHRSDLVTWWITLEQSTADLQSAVSISSSGFSFNCEWKEVTKEGQYNSHHN